MRDPVKQAAAKIRYNLRHAAKRKLSLKLSGYKSGEKLEWLKLFRHIEKQSFEHTVVHQHELMEPSFVFVLRGIRTRERLTPDVGKY